MRLACFFTTLCTIQRRQTTSLSWLRKRELSTSKSLRFFNFLNERIDFNKKWLGHSYWSTHNCFYSLIILFLILALSLRAGPLRKRSSSTVPVPVISEEYFVNPQENLSIFVLPPFTLEGIYTGKEWSHSTAQSFLHTKGQIRRNMMGG